MHALISEFTLVRCKYLYSISFYSKEISSFICISYCRVKITDFGKHTAKVEIIDKSHLTTSSIGRCKYILCTKFRCFH